MREAKLGTELGVPLRWGRVALATIDAVNRPQVSFVVAVALCMLPATGACASTEKPGVQGHSTESTQTTNNGPKAAIEATGFGGPPDSDYMWVTSVVKGMQPGQFAVASFNLLSADGTILATESQTEEAVNAGARMIVGTQVNKPKGGTVAKVDASLQVKDHKTGKPKLADVVLEIGPVSIGEDPTFGRPTAEAVVRNPAQEQIPGARMGVACYDGHGTIIGGGAEYPNQIPAGGQIKVAASVLTSQPPARCEMTGQPSDF